MAASEMAFPQGLSGRQDGDIAVHISTTEYIPYAKSQIERLIRELMGVATWKPIEQPWPAPGSMLCDNGELFLSPDIRSDFSGERGVSRSNPDPRKSDGFKRPSRTSKTTARPLGDGATV